MKVLIACEFSGVVRDAFRARGHEAFSCDLLPEAPRPVPTIWHYQCDARDLLHKGWDLLIAHPPCTRLCNSGVRWLAERNLWAELKDAAELFKAFLNANVPRIAVENPVMHKHAKALIGADFTQSIQPWQFGHGETKRTCLWLKNLPPLKPTNIVEGREARVHKVSPGPDRWKVRSVTYQGFADAMAEQWGSLEVARGAA